MVPSSSTAAVVCLHFAVGGVGTSSTGGTPTSSAGAAAANDTSSQAQTAGTGASGGAGSAPIGASLLLLHINLARYPLEHSSARCSTTGASALRAAEFHKRPAMARAASRGWGVQAWPPMHHSEVRCVLTDGPTGVGTD